MECPNGSETQSPRDVSFTETEDDILWKRAHVRSNTDPSSLATRVAQTHDTRINQTVAVNESSLTARGALNQPLPPSALKSDRKRKHGRRVGFGEANDQQLLPENRVQFSVPPEHLQTNNDNVVQSGVEASLFETDSHVAALTTPAVFIRDPVQGVNSNFHRMLYSFSGSQREGTSRHTSVARNLLISLW
jgi:hypothetical protein